MTTIGIRALKQNASRVVAEAAEGEVVTVTDRGRPVAQLIPLPANPLSTLLASGRARPAKRSLASLGAPDEPGSQERPLSEVVADMRSDERY